MEAENPQSQCFSAGSVTGAVIGTFVATLILLGIIWLVYHKMKKRKMQKSGLQDLVIVEEGKGDKAGSYENPAFVDESMDPKKSQHETGGDMKTNGASKKMSSDRGKKMPWGPFRFLFKSRGALDDSVLEEPQKYNVALRGHDFTGLGFNICGNMKDGIYVKDVMQRGPAAESKHIIPGDQITSMTVSFGQMVLDDAVTLLSYASPYEVSLEMMRHPDKSLSHKGLFISSSANPSDKTGTLERVCHPFFKSQSIDDLRKVGKEHLDQQVIRGKKQANGMKHSSSSTTMEVPTVVVVGTNEPRSSSSLKKSPNMDLSLGTGKISQEAHQREMSADEVDSPRGPIVPEIKVSAKMSKPEIIPRAKAKVANLKKEAPSASSTETKVVEAISPVIKMSADFEKMVEEHSVSISKPDHMQIDMPSGTDIEMKQVKSPHMEIDMTGPDVSIEPVTKPQRGKKKDKSKETKKEKQKDASDLPEGESGEKPKTGKFSFSFPDISLNFGKSKSGEEKEKTKEDGGDETKEKADEPKPEKEKNKGKDKDKKEMSPKKGKGDVDLEMQNVNEKELEQVSPEDKKPLEKSSSSGFGFSLKFPTFDKPILKRKDSSGSSSGEKEGEMKVETDPKAAGSSKVPKAKKEKKTKDDSRPTSPSSKESDKEGEMEGEVVMKTSMDQGESADMTGEKSGKKGTGFHMPSLGIKLPKFGHSKQTYSFENSGEASGKEGKHSEIPKMIEESIPTAVKVEASGDAQQKGMMKDEKMAMKAEIEMPTEARPSSPLGVSYGLYPPEVESEIKDREALSLSRSRSPTPLGDRSKDSGKMMKSQSDLTEKEGGKGESKPGLVSKGLKGLRDLKDKVSGRKSHDIQHESSSEDEGTTSPTPGAVDEDKVAAKEKAKLEKKAAKEAREKAAAEAKKEKERLKAEKKAKKAEEKAKKKEAAPNAGGHSSDSSSSSSEDSDGEMGDKDKKVKKEKKKSKSKEKVKSKEKKAEKKKGTTSPTPVETIEIIEEKFEVSETQSTMVSHEKSGEEKPPVAPRKKSKGKDAKNKEDKKDKEKKDKKSKKKKAGGESSSSSSSSSSESEDEAGKPTKPKRSAKRKAPVPPAMSSETETTMIKTESEMAVTSSADVTVQMNADSPTTKTPESGRRSASYGDLTSLQHKPKLDNMDRAVSVDFGGDNNEQMSPSGGTAIPVGAPLEDLSADPDPRLVISHFNQGQEKRGHKRSPSSVSSSSSETLRPSTSEMKSETTATTTSTTVTHTSNEAESVVTSTSVNVTSSDIETSVPNVAQIQKMMEEKISMMQNATHKMDSPSLVLNVPEKEVSSEPHSSKVTITASESGKIDRKEVEKMAQEAVDDIISDASAMGEMRGHTNGENPKTEKSETVQVPDESESLGRNVSVTRIQRTPDRDSSSMEGDSSAKQADISATSPTSLLRGDSKTRLMQTVADANTIKVNPISPLRKDSSMSSSSSSVDSSPEVRTDTNKPIFTTDNTTTTTTATPPSSGGGQTIEISSQELDGIMMSHSEFLKKQAAAGTITTTSSVPNNTNTNTTRMTPDSLEPIKDASFDTWVYVEEKNAANQITCTHSHSDPEPSTSSSNDDDEPYNRNGGMSPSPYRLETEYKYETSQMMVSTSPLPSSPSGEPSSGSPTTVYSTTMTLPQKSVTQITLGEPTVDSQGRIVSKITLEAPTPTTEQADADLPTLKPTK